MLIPFLKLELCILTDDDGAEIGVQVESSVSVFADKEVAERYRKVLELAVQAVIKEFEDAKGE